METIGRNEAATLYGQHMHICGFCGRDLTRKYSRNLGYGPECADNLGLPFDHAAYRASELVAA